MTDEERKRYEKEVIETLQRQLDTYLAERKKLQIIIVSAFVISLVVSTAILLLPVIFP